MSIRSTATTFWSGALSGTILLVRIIGENKIDSFFLGQVMLGKG